MVHVMAITTTTTMATEKVTEPLPSMKDLASSEPALRRKTLQQTISHLKSRPASHRLTHTQALQLWRGFHVALYMHDSKNQLSVQKLIATLASTLRIMRSKDIELERSHLVAQTLVGKDAQDVSIKAKSQVAGELAEASEEDGMSNHDPDNNDHDDDEFNGFDDDENNDHLDTNRRDLMSSTSNTTDDSGDTWLSTYTTAFWETISREWSGVDQWRMNKYLLLVRFVLREIFNISIATQVWHGYLSLEDERNQDSSHTLSQIGGADENANATQTKSKRKGTDLNDMSVNKDEDSTARPSTKKKKLNKSVGDLAAKSPTSPASLQHEVPESWDHIRNRLVLRTQVAILTQWPLSPGSHHVSNGLRLHVLDIYVDELVAVTSLIAVIHNAANAHHPAKVEGADLYTCLMRDVGENLIEPVQGLAKDGSAKNVRLRARDVVTDFESSYDREDVESMGVVAQGDNGSR